MVISTHKFAGSIHQFIRKSPSPKGRLTNLGLQESIIGGRSAFSAVIEFCFQPSNKPQLVVHALETFTTLEIILSRPFKNRLLRVQPVVLFQSCSNT